MEDNTKIGKFVDAIMVPLYERIPGMEVGRYNRIWSSLHKAKSEGFSSEEDLFTETVQNAFTFGVEMKYSEKSALRCSLHEWFHNLKLIRMDDKDSVLRMIRKVRI